MTQSAAVTAIAAYDLQSHDVPNVLVGRSDGSVEVYSFNEDGEVDTLSPPTLIHKTVCVCSRACVYAHVCAHAFVCVCVRVCVRVCWAYVLLLGAVCLHAHTHTHSRDHLQSVNSAVTAIAGGRVTSRDFAEVRLVAVPPRLTHELWMQTHTHAHAHAHTHIHTYMHPLFLLPLYSPPQCTRTGCADDVLWARDRPVAGHITRIRQQPQGGKGCGPAEARRVSGQLVSAQHRLPSAVNVVV